LIKKLGYDVLFECSNGKELMDQLKNSNQHPDIVLMDINMPEMDGYEATKSLYQNYPDVKVLALSVYDEEAAIIRMIRNGARGYLLKNSEAQDLKQAIESVYAKGFHYSDIVTGSLLHSVHKDEDQVMAGSISDRELEFLKLASTELTYKEIAGKMHLSPRTVDGYRDSLFEKLNVKSRVGLALFAVKNRIVQLN